MLKTGKVTRAISSMTINMDKEQILLKMEIFLPGNFNGEFPSKVRSNTLTVVYMKEVSSFILEKDKELIPLKMVIITPENGKTICPTVTGKISLKQPISHGRHLERRRLCRSNEAKLKYQFEPRKKVLVAESDKDNSLV